MILEYSLLSTLMTEPSLYSTVSLKVDHFEDHKAGRVFEVIGQLVAQKKEPELFIVAEALGDGDWVNYLTNIMYDYPSVPANVNAYEDKIKKAYRDREEEKVAQKFLCEIRSKVPEAASNAVNAIRALDDESPKGMQHVRDVVKVVLERIEEIQEQGIAPGIKTGITELDRLLGGLQAGDYTILAARTSVGKTATMLNFALNSNVSTGIISAEQGDEQLTQRLLANIAGIKSQRFRTGEFSEDDYPRLTNAVAELTGKEIYIDDKASPSIEYIEQTARRMQWKHGIKILFIDYIQKIRSEKYKDRHLQVGDVSRRLFALAKEMHIPIVVLAQLNRNADGKEPRLSDLRESGDIEQDADQIIFLHRSGDENFLDIIVAKNRFGPIAQTRARWIGEFMRLTDP